MVLLRRLLRRHPLVHWLAVLGLALATALSVARVTSAADAARRSWGTTQLVAVAAHPIAAGDRIGDGDVTVVAFPAGLAPPSALHAVPVGRAARVALSTGDVLRADDVAGGSAQGISALVPDGWRAVAVALGPSTLPLRPGDHVDLVATASDGTASGAIARDALVLAADERTLTVAVPARLADGVAAAATTGAVVPVLRGAAP